MHTPHCGVLYIYKHPNENLRSLCFQSLNCLYEDKINLVFFTDSFIFHFFSIEKEKMNNIMAADIILIALCKLSWFPKQVGKAVLFQVSLQKKLLLKEAHLKLTWFRAGTQTYLSCHKMLADFFHMNFFHLALFLL